MKIPFVRERHEEIEEEELPEEFMDYLFEASSAALKIVTALEHFGLSNGRKDPTDMWLSDWVCAHVGNLKPCEHITPEQPRGAFVLSAEPDKATCALCFNETFARFTTHSTENCISCGKEYRTMGRAFTGMAAWGPFLVVYNACPDCAPKLVTESPEYDVTKGAVYEFNRDTHLNLADLLDPHEPTTEQQDQINTEQQDQINAAAREAGELAQQMADRNPEIQMGEVSADLTIVEQDLQGYVEREFLSDTLRLCLHLNEQINQPIFMIKSVPGYAACKDCVPLLPRDEDTCCDICGASETFFTPSMIVMGTVSLMFAACDDCMAKLKP